MYRCKHYAIFIKGILFHKKGLIIHRLGYLQGSCKQSLSILTEDSSFRLRMAPLHSDVVPLVCPALHILSSGSACLCIPHLGSTHIAWRRRDHVVLTRATPFCLES